MFLSSLESNIDQYGLLTFRPNRSKMAGEIRDWDELPMIKEERKRQQKKEKVKIVIEIVLVVIMLVCIANMVSYFVREKRAAAVYEDMQKESVITGTVLNDIENEEASFLYAQMPQVDFEMLWETNPDICAWIYIPNTQVNYPVLQNSKATEPYDTYYLKHTVDGQSGLPGAIYIEPCNRKNFVDYNTVLYGHHMKNGSMFASLDSYLEETFMEENPYVYLVTPEKNMVYEIFAAVQYDDRHIIGSYDFEDTAGRQSFLDSLAVNADERNVLREDVEVTSEDRLITLSTCVKGQDEKRLLVEAVLIDEAEH